MKKIVTIAEEGISLLDLLLDETLCEGEILIPADLVRVAGGENRRLQAKKKYELLLRIAQKGAICLEEVRSTECGQAIEFTDDDPQSAEQYGWRTDCYVIGKYRTILWESGYYDAAVKAVLNEAQQNGCYETTVQYLMKMIGNTEEFYRIDDATRPILIYKGDTTCHSILTIFAEQFGAALERKGEHVIYFDIAKEDVLEIVRFADQHFKAVIGIQSGVFEVQTENGTYFHEYIHGPKFNFISDHPVWAKWYLTCQLPDFHVLTHDNNYVSFIKKYYKTDAIFFPLPGMYIKHQEIPERIYDITFVGAYGEYQEEVRWIREQSRPLRFVANRFLLIMRKNPNLTAEEAFEKTLEYYGMQVSEEEFLDNMYLMRRMLYVAGHYYRYKVIQTILDAGIRVDVFGDSWKKCPLRKYPNLICHPDITVEEGLTIFQKSKLSLNIMSWHKGGFTERMAGIMLAGAVLVTDYSQYLQGHYDENDMLIFDLEHIEELPEKIGKVLLDAALRSRIAESGRKKTEQEHTWDRRAEQFLELLF